MQIYIVAYINVSGELTFILGLEVLIFKNEAALNISVSFSILE